MIKGEHPQHAKAQVRHRRVGHQFFHIRLHPCRQRAVDNAYNRQHCHEMRHIQAGIRHHRQGQPQKAIGPQLQQDAGQDHTARRRRLGMGQRQPGMKRKQRHLHRKPGKERQENPELRRCTDVGIIKLSNFKRQ